MSFGIGLGAFAEGLTRGIGTGMSIKDARLNRELKKRQLDMQEQQMGFQRQQFGETQRMNNARIEGLGIANDRNRLQFKGERQAYDDTQATRGVFRQGIEEAKKNTDGSPAAVNRYFANEYGPKVSQHFMEIGQPDTAEKWNSWVKDKNVQKAQAFGGQMLNAMEAGDWDGVGKYFGLAYNSHGYYPNGITFTGLQYDRDDAGDVTGATLSFRNDETGEESTTRINSKRDLMGLIEAAADPLKVFEQTQQLEQAKAEQAVKTQAEIDKENRDHAWDAQKAGIDQQNKLEAQGNQSMLNDAEAAAKARRAAENPTLDNKVAQDTAAKVAILKQYGYSDDDIAKLVPNLLDISDGKPMNQRVEALVKTLSANDLGGSDGFSRKTPEEQAKIAYDMIQAIDSVSGQPPASSSQTGQPPAQQSAGPGLTPPSAGQGAAKGGRVSAGIPFYDPKTGKVVIINP